MALTKPFAENGDKTTIPATTSDGSVSYDQGFGSFYALPPEEGGLFIDRAQFNQLMYDTTSAVLENNSSIANIQNTINQVISSEIMPISVYKNVKNKTIGANGDFKTIQEAFTYVQTHQKQSLNQNLIITLLENLNNEVLYFKGAWYPYLIIDCNGFVLADKLTTDLSCFRINNLKLNDRLVASVSSLWLTGNISINYQSDDYPQGCLTALAGSSILVGGDFQFSTTSNKSGFASVGNSTIYITSINSITQTDGVSCFSVHSGGIIQLNNNLNMAGVTVPKASQAANTITNSGLIIGNYYQI